MEGKFYIELLNSPAYFTKYEITPRGRGVIPSPLEYEEMMNVVPNGKIITTEELTSVLAKKHKVDYTCPRATDFHIEIVARAAIEKAVLGSKLNTPYWRTLRKNGELNEGYPEGVIGQRFLLEKEGHTIVVRRKKFYVKNYKEKLCAL